ncbi:MAG: ribosome small subunit-dependent GTPase A [Epulopiscium sp.]|nr:ribosome small subunit-dependent GTPase A [Candidatus Epulonipiscium sp.]
MILEGTIIKGIAGFYYVATEQNIYECKARGKFRNEDITPMIGDHVVIQISSQETNTGSIIDITPRKNLLIRPPVSNVDQVIIVFSIAQPDPNLYLLDRFLLLIEEQNLPAYICFNKVDLKYQNALIEMQEIYKKAGYDVIITSTITKEGVSLLQNLLINKITVFAGPSGVGKSSLLNEIQPSLQLKTGDISYKLKRGKHTTRHVELLPLENGGYVIDTPGFTSMQINHLSIENLAYYYREFQPYLSSCQFHHCSHIHEPSCGVKEAVKQGKITLQRYESYVSMYNEIQQQRRW